MYEVLSLLESWVLHERPTAIIGDFNINFSEDNKINRAMEKSGFQQLIRQPTYEEGSIIDHIYANKLMQKLNVSVEKYSVHYSDHDIITLYIPE